MSQRAVIEQSGTNERALTYREMKVVERIVAHGDSPRKALQRLGFPESCASHPSKIITPEVQAKIAEVQAALAAHALNKCLVDAAELHEQLSEHMRGDLADLYDESGEILPVKDWPLWARTGGVEFVDEPNMVHSDDDGGGSWDQKGRKVRVLGKSRAKTLELLMKHRAVNAMVQAPAAQVQVNVIDAETVRLATLLSPEQLEQVRQRVIAGSTPGSNE